MTEPTNYVMSIAKIAHGLFTSLSVAKPKLLTAINSANGQKVTLHVVAQYPSPSQSSSESGVGAPPILNDVEFVADKVTKTVYGVTKVDAVFLITSTRNDVMGDNFKAQYTLMGPEDPSIPSVVQFAKNMEMFDNGNLCVQKIANYLNYIPIAFFRYAYFKLEPTTVYATFRGVVQVEWPKNKDGSWDIRLRNSTPWRLKVDLTLKIGSPLKDAVYQYNVGPPTTDDEDRVFIGDFRTKWPYSDRVADFFQISVATGSNGDYYDVVDAFIPY